MENSSGAFNTCRYNLHVFSPCLGNKSSFPAELCCSFIFVSHSGLRRIWTIMRNFTPRLCRRAGRSYPWWMDRHKLSWRLKLKLCRKPGSKAIVWLWRGRLSLKLSFRYALKAHTYELILCVFDMRLYGRTDQCRCITGEWLSLMYDWQTALRRHVDADTFPQKSDHLLQFCETVSQERWSLHGEWLHLVTDTTNGRSLRNYFFFFYFNAVTFFLSNEQAQPTHQTMTGFTKHTSLLYSKCKKNHNRAFIYLIKG